MPPHQIPLKLGIIEIGVLQLSPPLTNFRPRKLTERYNSKTDQYRNSLER
jgi:hypothetical protein